MSVADVAPTHTKSTVPAHANQFLQRFRISRTGQWSQSFPGYLPGLRSIWSPRRDRTYVYEHEPV